MATAGEPTHRNPVLSLLFGVAVFAVLFAGFRWNCWCSASDASFASGLKSIEALVIGRLSASRELGFFAEGGLLGFVGNRPELLTFDTAVLWNSYNPYAQMHFYLEQAPFESFGPFFSHSGLQGSAFALLDRIFGFLDPASRLSLFFTVTAALAAGAYASIVVLFQRELGAFSALLGLAAVLLSPWLTIFARNIYFSIWLSWLPAIAMGAILAHWRGRRGEGWWLALAAFLAFLVRFLSGYEFITERVALGAAPILYFSIRDRVGLHTFLRRSAIAAGAATLALGLSLGILTLQIGQATGSTENALKHFELAIARRTHGDPSLLPPVYARSLQASTSDVVRMYLDDSFDREAGKKPPPLRWLLARSSRDLIVCTFAAALWIAARAFWLPLEYRSRALGLIGAAVITLAGVMAWLTIFKAHSFIHLHVNPILWHLGFFSFGAALVGFALEDALRLVVRRPWCG
jgi:hypothetical protein